MLCGTSCYHVADIPELRCWLRSYSLFLSCLLPCVFAAANVASLRRAASLCAENTYGILVFAPFSAF